jgi:hypothetical protein
MRGEKKPPGAPPSRRPIRETATNATKAKVRFTRWRVVKVSSGEASTASSATISKKPPYFVWSRFSVTRGSFPSVAYQRSRRRPQRCWTPSSTEMP